MTPIYFRKFQNLGLVKGNLDVLIIDEGSEYIIDCLPDGLKVEILEVRDTIPYIFSFSFFYFCIKRVIRFGFALKSLIVIVPIVKILNPRVVITFIDNKGIMGELSEIFPNKTIISVQNGIRLDYEFLTGDRSYNFKSSIYFGFGDYELDLMKGNQAIVEEYHAVGSLKLGLFLSKHNNKALSNSGGVCFVSQYRSQQVNSSKQVNVKCTGIVRDVYRQLVDYTSVNKYKLYVTMFHHKGEDDYTKELDFFKSIVNSDRVEFLPNSKSRYSSYKASIKSEVIVTMDSTLGFEMFGCGKKILFCSPIDPVFAKMRGVEGLFEKMPNLVKLQGSLSTQLTELMNIDNAQYNKIVGNARAYFMKSGKPYPHEIISSYVFNAITEGVSE